MTNNFIAAAVYSLPLLLPLLCVMAHPETTLKVVSSSTLSLKIHGSFLSIYIFGSSYEKLLSAIERSVFKFNKLQKLKL